jgi:hypothetical protein
VEYGCAFQNGQLPEGERSVLLLFFLLMNLFPPTGDKSETAADSLSSCWLLQPSEESGQPLLENTIVVSAPLFTPLGVGAG